MSNVTMASTTSSQEELEHAVGPNWREPFVPKEAPKEESPEAEETTAETAAAPEPAEETGSEKPKAEQKKSGWQKRIDKLTARNHLLEKELEEARKTKPAAEAAPEADLPPQLKDFKTPEEWADARDAWKEAKAEREAQAEETKAVLDDYNKATSDARGKYDDWEETVGNPDIMIPVSVQSAIVEMGKEGPDVAYYLGKHPEVCEELMAMKPLSAVIRIGKIADGLKGSAKSSPEASKPKPKLPAPISTVGANSARTSVPLDQMSPRDYIRARNAQEAARKR